MVVPFHSLRACRKCGCVYDRHRSKNQGCPVCHDTMGDNIEDPSD